MRNLVLAVSASCLLATALTGCGSGNPAWNTRPTAAGQSLQGSVHGGQQPVANARIYILAANTAGYGQPSLSLLDPNVTGHADSLGAYVLTTPSGNFNISGDYTCTPSSQVYLFVTGGDPGAGPNSALGLMAALGNCPAAGNFEAIPFISINEVSTVAAAFALSGYATDATHISSSGTPLAQTGIANAFANVANLTSVGHARALASTPAGNGVAPFATINTLANILAACVNSTGPQSGPCVTLFLNSLSAGSSGTQPTDTASAAINIAHNPAANVANLFNLPTPAAPFSPALAAMPGDFTLAIVFSGGGISGPSSIAIDGSGNAWTTSISNNSVNELTSTGAVLSPSNGFSDAATAPVSIAIDLNDNAWIANAVTYSVTEISSSGATVSPAPYGFAGGGLQTPQGIAIDGSGEPWVASYRNTVSRFSNSGAPLSPAFGYTGAGLNGPAGIALDSDGAAWIPNKGNGAGASVSKFAADGTPLSPATGFLDGGLNQPAAVAIDAAGNAWVANFGGNTVTRLDPTGTPLSVSSGISGGGIDSPFAIAIDGAGNAWVADYFTNSISLVSAAGAPVSPASGYRANSLNSPRAIAIDGSGNVWVTNSADVTVTEIIGAAAPVVTPLAAGIKNHTLGTRP